MRANEPLVSARGCKESDMLMKLLYTRKEAAELLSVSLRQVDHLLRAGTLESRRIGRRRLIPGQTLEKLSRADHVPPKTRAL
jgi:excisionase family DNA binding protein